MIVYPSRRYYEHIARLSGYLPGPLETVFRLVDLLAHIEETLPDELLLRGGTALNLLHLDAPRLSVDLDLDYVGAADAPTAQERRPDLLAKVEEVAQRGGYVVVRARPSYAMAHLVLRYRDATGKSAALKLDINFLDRVPVLEPVHLPLRHPFGSDVEVPAVQTFALDELAASKVIALARRGLARDLFDVAELADIARLDRDMVRTVTVVRGAAFPPPSPNEYAADAGAGVRLAQWRSEVVALALRDRQTGLPAAQTRAAAFLRELLTLSQEQLDFLRMLDAGTLDADCLGTPALKGRVESNPGLLWRLRRGASALEER